MSNDKKRISLIIFIGYSREPEENTVGEKKNQHFFFFFYEHLLSLAVEDHDVNESDTMCLEFGK